MNGNEGRGRVAVVIGGGSGIGEATSLLLGEQGWKVVVADVNMRAAADVASRCSGAAHAIDILQPEMIESAAAEIDRLYGPVHACICVAAVFQDKLPPEDTPIDAVDRILDVNLRGTYLLNVAFGKRMAAHGRGVIVNFSSWNGFQASPVHVYCASKAAVNRLTESMAVEWGRSGVRVNAVTPGFVLVPRMKERLRTGGRYSGRLEDLSPLGKIVEPREVAETVAFIVSDRASAMTGSNIVVDAGVMAAAGWGIFGGIPPSRSLANLPEGVESLAGANG